MVDNAFATSALQRPLEFGADVVAYSATKLMDGQGRVLAGAVCGSTNGSTARCSPFQRNTGPIASPFNAWVVLKGLETLDLRAHKQSENALEVGRVHRRTSADDAPSRPAEPSRSTISRPGRWMPSGRSSASWSPAGATQAFAVLDALELVDISNNIGDAKSLACHPATTTHNNMGPEGRAEMGVEEGMIRINIGLEDPQD